MTDLRIEIPGAPVAQGRPRLTTISGYARAYDPKKSRDWKTMVSEYGHLAMKAHGYKKLLDGPLKVMIKFIMPLPKSAHRKRIPVPEKWSTKKPDIDNLYKGIADGLEGVVFHNDSYISDVRIQKKIAEQGVGPRTIILISTIEE
jgi:Holliday junction resolvase RusA-like endonuclease